MWPLILIAVIIALAVLAFVIVSHLPVFRMTSHAECEVVACDEEQLERHPPRYQTRVTFRYRAGTRTLEAARTFPGQRSGFFTAGRKFRLYYTPANPTECRVVTPELH